MNLTLDSLIVCGTKATHDCGFYDLIALVQVAIKDLTIIATLLTIIGCVFVGFLLMTSGGSSGAREEAKKKAWLLLKGYLIILGAWIFVYTIAHTLLNPGEYVNVLGNP
jgi:hypothetical protein